MAVFPRAQGGGEAEKQNKNGIGEVQVRRGGFITMKMKNRAINYVATSSSCGSKVCGDRKCWILRGLGVFRCSVGLCKCDIGS